jgi:hypothetical protein
MCGSLSFSKFLDPAGIWKKDEAPPAPEPITSANQQQQAVDTQAQVNANAQAAQRRKKSTSLYGTGSAMGASDTGTALAAGKTTLGQ